MAKLSDHNYCEHCNVEIIVGKRYVLRDERGELVENPLTGDTS